MYSPVRAGLLLLSLWPVVAFAQLAPTPPEEPDVASTSPDLSQPEKLERSAESLSRIRVVLKDTLVKLEEARDNKDVVKLNCVNEKLTQIKGLLRISEQADVGLQESVAKHESSLADHEFAKVTIARQKSEQLRAEAEECVGQLAFRTDENLTVEVEAPDDLPTGDQTSIQTPATARPPPGSPVR